MYRYVGMAVPKSTEDDIDQSRQDIQKLHK